MADDNTLTIPLTQDEEQTLALLLARKAAAAAEKARTDALAELHGTEAPLESMLNDYLDQLKAVLNGVTDPEASAQLARICAILDNDGRALLSRIDELKQPIG